MAECIDLDPVVLEHLAFTMNQSIQELLCSDSGDDGKVISLPSSLSPSQVDFVLNLVTQSKDILVEVKWFYPKLTIELKRKLPNIIPKNPFASSSLVTASESVPPGSFAVQLVMSPQLQEMLVKLCIGKSRRISPPLAHRVTNMEQFQANFSIITYINTDPVVPTKFAPKAGPPNLLFAQCIGGGGGAGSVLPHQLATTFYPHLSGIHEISETDNLLLKQLAGVDRIHVVSGLCKVDKLNLTLLLNNEAFLGQKPCRIIYLQSMSILTFWMALKVKELCGDYHWNCSGYQITLESKSSPNNNIIFFELSSFMRALNMNIDASLVTHLIVDIDHQHSFFGLFLLYLKTNFAQMRHLRLIIFAKDATQARVLYEYFAPEIVNLVDWMDFYKQLGQLHMVPETLGGTQHLEPVNITHLYLEDISQYGITRPSSDSLYSGKNPEMERLLPSIFHSDDLSPSIMIEFTSSFPVLLNYQCHALNGITPLILAIIRASVDQVYRLLSAGASAHLCSWNGMSPIEWAIVAQREQIFNLLMVHLTSIDDSFDLNLRQYYSERFLSATINAGCDIKKMVLQVPTKRISQLPPLYSIDYSLILRLLLGMIRQLSKNHQPNSALGTILVLLPSYNEISTMRKQIIASLSPIIEHPFTTFCLYPHLPNNELDIAVGLLSSVNTSQVRVILSTFTLDSVLLSDIRYVINTGVRLCKVKSAITPTSLFRLMPNQSVDKIAEYLHYRDLFCESSPGQQIYFYNLYSRHDVLNGEVVQNEAKDQVLEPQDMDSMYQCILASKGLKLKGINKIADMFNQMVSAAPKMIVDNTVHFLRSLNMFDEKEQFTELGRILVDLSIEPHYAKMIIYSLLLRCLDPILTIVCALSSPNCFELSKNSTAQRCQEMQSLVELSHQSFSDHLTYVYAFQKWQELCRSNPKNVTTDRSGIILFSSFELVYSLRTKILGQLRACGFVKGKGSMNIRQLNTNSDNFTLVKAAICSGQSADNLALLHKNSASLAHKDKSKQPFSYLHPNSVLAHYLATGQNSVILTSNLVMFDKKISSGQVSYLCNCTLINPLTVAIFADETPCGSEIVLKDSNCIQIGGWDEDSLKILGDKMTHCFELRTRWQQFVRKRIANMHSPVSEEENHLMAELTRFCVASDEQAGFGKHPCIGRAPQVMSTYFCSTKMIAPVHHK